MRLCHQRTRSKLYGTGKHNHLATVIESTDEVGDHATPAVLSSSYIGSHRCYKQAFHDAIETCCEHGRPDLFITVTCNPKWEEITRMLRPGQSAKDRPDLCARVFRTKLNEIMDDIEKRHIFGRTVARVYSVEWQARGQASATLLTCDRSPKLTQLLFRPDCPTRTSW